MMPIQTMSVASYLNILAYIERIERYERRKAAKARMQADAKRAVKFVLRGGEREWKSS